MARFAACVALEPLEEHRARACTWGFCESQEKRILGHTEKQNILVVVIQPFKCCFLKASCVYQHREVSCCFLNVSCVYVCEVSATHLNPPEVESGVSRQKKSLPNEGWGHPFRPPMSSQAVEKIWV